MTINDISLLPDKYAFWLSMLNHKLLLMLLMGAHVGVAHRGGHGSAPAQGVPERGVPCVRHSW